MANKPVLLTVDDPEVLRAVERECAERLQHICADGGTGVPLKNRIFKPFFTTKGIGEETGLSLGETRFKARLPMNGPRRGSDSNGNGG